MSVLILHNYAMSPFSQKMRSMLGYAGLNWQSVVCREMPPRPQLEILAGGYRKIPVGQIGADVFCDTRSIASEVARLSAKPELALENCSQAVQDYVARVDLDIFFASLLNSGTRRMASKVWQAMSAMDIGRFFMDRVRIGRRASVNAVGPKEARAVFRSHLQDLEARLNRDFIFGDEPNHGDFSAFHSLWFVTDLAEAGHVKSYPHVQAWMDRMRSFGEGVCTEISADEALEQARQSEPRNIPIDDKMDDLIGQPVSIGPSDYAKDRTTGRLVGSSRNYWILSRKEPTLGMVHTHFPKQGYQLKPGQP